MAAPKMLVHIDEDGMRAVDLEEAIFLSCTCEVQLYKVMLLAGIQALRGEEILCPEHKTKYSLGENPTFMAKAMAFVKGYKDHLKKSK